MPGLFSSGDTSINYPAQPSYGEGMREALEAQVALLTGTQVGDADFRQFPGGLEALVQQYEAPLRQTTAQIDTDILRQTLLGREQKVERVEDPETGEVRYGIPGAQVVTGEDGEPQTIDNDRYQLIMTDPGRSGGLRGESGSTGFSAGKTPTYQILDTQTGGIATTIGGELYQVPDKTVIGGKDLPEMTNEDARSDALKQIGVEFKSLRNVVDEGGDVSTEFTFTNPNIPADPSKAGQTGYDSEGRTLLKEGDVVRQGDGMLDLLGDTRKVQGRRLDFKQYVLDNPDIAQQFARDKANKDIPANMSMEEYGREHYETTEVGQAEVPLGRVPPKELFGDLDRRAGFDEQGNFLGLSAFAEDLQRANLSRQREADLTDVERLSGRFQDVMEDFRPGTAEAVSGARDVLESQKDRLTGTGLITKPTSDTFGGTATPATLTAASLGKGPTLEADTSFTAASLGTSPTLDANTSYDALDALTRQKLTADTSYTPSAGVTGGSFTAAQAADPMALTAATSFDPSAGVTGEGFTATAGLQGGAIAADPLRQALMADAEAALKQGLTDREERQIAEAARARATMMGRTFDQSEAIREAQARVLEDNQRRMQNRAFAQQVLGQEAGLQESDLSRGLQAAAQNQAALNRAAEFTAGQGMQAQLANQAATNEALRLGMAAGLSQEALAAQQQQAREFANIQALNRALEFEQNQALQAQLANQQATNRAREFAAQAGISQEEAMARLGQQAELTEFGAEQQRQESALQAGLQQDQAQAAIDQQAQRDQANLTQQARMAALEAGMQQDAQQAELDQQRDILQAQLNQQGAVFGAEARQQAALADQRQRQQANQFGVGAEMDAERLNAQLAQQGALGFVDAATRLAALEDQTTLDPFAALLNRAGGGSLGQAGQVFGQAGYGLSSGPQYLNPESGLGYISQMAANEANLYAANQAANASRGAGLIGGLGAIGSGLFQGAGAAQGFSNLFCWVAREVYGPMNPKWMQFREWMFAESPRWFFNLYRKFGERFANWISDKPRIKVIIRKWMDSKIGDK